MVQAVSFEEGKKILDTVPGAVLVDVRTEEEYTAAHAQGAVLMPVEELEDMPVEEFLPDTHAPVLVYCRTGRRAAQAAGILSAMGYTRIYDLGGLNGWPYGMSFGLEP